MALVIPDRLSSMCMELAEEFGNRLRSETRYDGIKELRSVDVHFNLGSGHSVRVSLFPNKPESECPSEASLVREIDMPARAEGGEKNGRPATAT